VGVGVTIFDEGAAKFAEGVAIFDEGAAIFAEGVTIFDEGAAKFAEGVDCMVGEANRAESIFEELTGGVADDVIM
jgi:hypothetical protein